MRFKTIEGDKADTGSLFIKNADTVVLPKGAPVCLNFNGTDDGLAVILPSNSAAKAYAYLLGVVGDDIPVGGTGYAKAAGFCRQILYAYATRAASGSSWSATASVAAGVPLNVDTVNNVFVSSGGTVAATAFLPWGVFAETVSAIVASASATSDSRTVITGYVKAFLRLL